VSTPCADAASVRKGEQNDLRRLAMAFAIAHPGVTSEILGEPQVLNGHDHEQVVAGAHGGYLRRSDVNRRVWTPAAAGDPTVTCPRSSPACTSTTCATPTRPD
jgi:hypothetical protein